MIDCCKFVVVSGSTPQQKALFLKHVEGCLSQALEAAIKVRDHEEVSNITEAYSVVMPYMEPQMLAALPTKMMAVVGMINGLTKEVEKVYADKEMDDDLNEEMDN